MSPALKSLLFDIRQNAAFQELLSTVEAPKITPFKKRDAAQIEHTRAQWIFESGQIDQHNRWLGILTGNQENT